MQNHENQGPVHIIFDSPLVRRLSHSSKNVHDKIKAYIEGGDNNFSHEEGDRLLEETNSALSTLTMTFKQCIFEVSFKGYLLTVESPH